VGSGATINKLGYMIDKAFMRLATIGATAGAVNGTIHIKRIKRTIKIKTTININSL
jgi:hypothetical protein